MVILCRFHATLAPHRFHRFSNTSKRLGGDMKVTKQGAGAETWKGLTSHSSSAGRKGGKFTIEELKNLEVKDLPYYLTAQEGFSVRVLTSGVKTFYFRYTVNGKKQQIKIGNFAEVPRRRGEITLKDAKNTHTALFKDYCDGKDPKAPNIIEEDPIPANKYEDMTIADLADVFLDFTGKPENRAPSTHKEYKRTIEKFVIPFFEKYNILKLTSVKKHHAIKLITDVAANRKDNGELIAGQARAVLKITRAMWNFQLEKEDSAYRNPFSDLEKVKEIQPLMKTKKQQRALGEKEIRHIWTMLNSSDGPGSASVARALMMVLVTGQRPGEVAGMHRSEITDDWWQIPAHRIKTRCHEHHDHRVYLSPLAKQIIGTFPEYIFPSSAPDCQGKPIQASSMSKLLRGELASKEGEITRQRWLGLTKKFTPNDLRKTMRTHLSSIGCPKDVGEEILNHSQNEVAARYNLYKYDPEKQLWMVKWAERLHQMLEDQPITIRTTDDPYDIQQLENLVERMPLTAVAKQLGISDNAVRKRCKKHGVALKPRGVWLKGRPRR